MDAFTAELPTNDELELAKAFVELATILLQLPQSPNITVLLLLILRVVSMQVLAAGFNVDLHYHGKYARQTFSASMSARSSSIGTLPGPCWPEGGQI